MCVAVLTSVVAGVLDGLHVHDDAARYQQQSGEQQCIAAPEGRQSGDRHGQGAHDNHGDTDVGSYLLHGGV